MSAPERRAPDSTASGTRSLAELLRQRFLALRLWAVGLFGMVLLPLAYLQAHTEAGGLREGNPVLILELLMLGICVLEMWSIRVRGRGSALGNVLPVGAVLATLATLWVNGPGNVLFISATAVILFVFLPLRSAAYLTLAMMCGGFWILVARWDAEGTMLMRIPIGNGIVLALLMIVGQSVDALVQEYRRTLQLLENTLQSLEHGIAVVGTDGVIKAWNAKAADIFDVPAEFRDGRTVTVAELVALQKARGELAVVAASSPEAAHAIEFGWSIFDPNFPERFLRRSMKGRWIEVVTRRMPSGEIVRSYADVTPYQEAIQAAERAAIARASFLGSVSHEFNTPLNAILGLSHLALQSDLSLRQRQWVEQIQSAGHQLSQLVGDVLDVTSVESGAVALSRAPYRLAEVLVQVEQAVAPRCAAKGVAFEVTVERDVPPELVGDADRVRRVLTVLAKHAERATERGRVEIQVMATSDASGRPALRFAVRDTGIGLTDEQRRRVLRGTATEAEASLWGGIALSQRYIELMGGVMRVESTLGRGATFWFTLPTTPREGMAPADAAVRRPLASPPVAARTTSEPAWVAPSREPAAPPRSPSVAQTRLRELIDLIDARRTELSVLPYRGWVFGTAIMGIGLIVMAILVAVNNPILTATIRNRAFLPANLLALIFLLFAWQYRRYGPTWDRAVRPLALFAAGILVVAMLVNGAQASIFLPVGVVYFYLVLPGRWARAVTVTLAGVTLILFVRSPGEFVIYSRTLTAGVITIFIMDWLMRAMRLSTETFALSATQLGTVSLDVLADNAALEESRKAAEEAAQRRTDLMSAVSHEIRTPMNAILGLTQLALQSDLAARQREWMERIRQNGALLLELVTNILDVTRMEAGKAIVETAPLDLDEVVRQASDVLAVEAEAKGLRHDVEVGADVPRRLLGDRIRLTQILLNLVSNAVKYTARGRVSVRVQRVPDETPGVQLRIEVQDTGRGIPAEEQGRIFRPFEQLGSGGTRYGGAGLGLSITKWLVEQMGGSIGVRSQPGVGSTFWCTVRLTEAPVGGREGVSTAAAPADRRRRRHLRGLRGARVLVVDDNAINRDITMELLRHAGLEPEEAADGEAAIARIEAVPYDLVLLDVQMPGLDGLAVTARVRAFKSAEALPIVAMTASTLAEDRARCLAAGMNDHLSKPFEPSDLWEILRRWIPARDESGSADSFTGAGVSDAEVAALPRVRGLMVEQGVQRVLGNVGLYRSLLVEFARGQSDVVARIREAMLAGDLASAERHAHALTGVAGGIGATEVQAVAASLEGEIRRGCAWSEVAAMVDELRLRLTPLLADLEGITESALASGERARASGDAAEMSARLEEFAALLAASDPAAREWIARHGALLDPLGSAAPAIRDAVARYDLSAAAALLRAAREG